MNAEALARAVADRTGIVVGGGSAAVGRAASRVLRRHGAVAGEELLDRVVDEFTIKETSFFREDEPLRSLDWHGLLERARRRGDDTVSVWSAACSTGEEPYTLAILACEAFGTATPPVQIFATDVSRAALDAARVGRYRDRSLRAVPGELRERWFTAAGDASVVADPIRRLVTLRQHNLVRDPVVGRFDVVLCRNVLIYFDAPTATAVRERLAAAVNDGGRLVLGAADALCGTPPAAPVVAKPRRRPRPRPRRAPQAEDASELFARGVAHLDADDPGRAVEPLRRALYLDPSFTLASFHLARAYDRLGEPAAAVRLYGQTLRTLDPADELGDVAAACLTRIEQENNR